MINLPDYKKSFDYENNFYLSCNINRISKILAHYELFKMTHKIPGAIVECGVFKGASFVRWASFRNLFGNPYSKKIIGFDTFKNFPETTFLDDKQVRNKFIESAGDECISKDQLLEVLKHKEINQLIELVKGDITKTVPEYVRQHPELRISLLNLDTDIYEPAVTILKYLYPLIVQGGVIIIDDYGVFPGETKAVDEYLTNVNIQKFPFCMSPSYIVKE